MSKRVSHKYISRSPSETKKIAVEIVKKAWAARGGGGVVVALAGDLGSGKTIFVQGVAAYLGVTATVASPTFVLMKRYEIQEERVASLGLNGLRNLYHFDCYRLESSQAILDLGWEEIISTEGNLIFVEWAEKIKDILPLDTVWLRFKGYNETEREIVIE